jgi:hypothetical protein
MNYAKKKVNEVIKLTKKSKKTKKVNIEIFDNFDELEERLIKISTAHYNISDYTIEADDFKEAIAIFQYRYNPDYFMIDYDLEVINIKKLEVGQKRKLFFKKEKQNKTTALSRAINRLQKKYNLIYDEDLGIIEIVLEEGKLSFELNEEEIKIENVSFNEIEVDKIKDITKLSKDITNYFDRLGKRIKK